ncbi:hypothetical protein [Pediococcus parvulus]|uniref:hypothetical protein n=2 Tax=Pediococcus parvulus TaxID=54062 RepID=UPI00345E4394
MTIREIFLTMTVIRNREVITKLDVIEEKEPFIINIMRMVTDESINYNSAKKLIFYMRRLKMNELEFFIIMIVILILEEFIFTNTRYFWLGGIIPFLGTIGIIYILVESQNIQFQDYLIAAIGIIVLLIMWGDGHERYSKRIKKQKNRMFEQDLMNEKRKK